MKNTSGQSVKHLGAQLRAIRLRQNINQAVLAARSGIALNALKRLESGRGGTVRSLLSVVRALGRQEWIEALSPPVSVSPMQLLERKKSRQRASRRRAG